LRYRLIEKFEFFILICTPYVLNYLSVLIGTQILRNLWRLCENAQLGYDPSLNKLFNEIFYTQNGFVNKIGLIKL
jgi:hypothetical protein